MFFIVAFCGRMLKFSADRLKKGSRNTSKVTQSDRRIRVYPRLIETGVMIFFSISTQCVKLLIFWGFKIYKKLGEKLLHLNISAFVSCDTQLLSGLTLTTRESSQNWNTQFIPTCIDWSTNFGHVASNKIQELTNSLSKRNYRTTISLATVILLYNVD
jgi:hypothetical protein